MLPSDRVLQHQYWARNYQHYADLIRDLLQAEKHDELTIMNHHQHHVGDAPLPEIHPNEKKASSSKDNNPTKNGRSARRRRNRRKNK
jgi:dihydrofolate reductase